MSVEVVEREAAERRVEAATAEQNGSPALRLRDARLLLMGLWLGASLFFSFVVAPGAFAVLRDSTALYANHLAGQIVTRNLAFINTSGLIISLILLATAFVFRSRRGGWAFTVEIISLAVVGAMTGVGQWVIAARMLILRQQMGRPIDETAANDPLRVAFNSLHVYSVAALTIAMLAALVAIILISRRARRAS
jgi:heme/copper-type cytochrome/quinol oxidase subunit 3